MILRGRGGGSVGRALTTQAQGPDLNWNPQHPHEKLLVAVLEHRKTRQWWGR